VPQLGVPIFKWLVRDGLLPFIFAVYFLQAGCCCRPHLAAQQLSSRHKSHARQVILMCQKDVKLVKAREARGRSWLRFE
jgi:hypothetical protein